jgi:hypothetical protein
MNEITKEQLEELEEARSCFCKSDFNDLLEDYTGIKAVPYTAFQYYDSADNFVGDSDNYDVREILENAYITVKE